MTSQHTLIIGGSSGIGLATARRRLKDGDRVTIAGRSEARLEQARETIGGDVGLLKMDATDAAALAGHFSRIERFDHLVLAAGSDKGMGPFATVNLDDVKRGFEEKVFAHVAAAQAALPFLNANGSMTFIAAVSAHAAVHGTAGIGAVNAAVVALVPILAVELKPLRVNGVSPGIIETPWWDIFPKHQRQAAFDAWAAKTPVGRVGRAEDVADAIAFLIGNSFMTGHVLICDGGVQYTA